MKRGLFILIFLGVVIAAYVYMSPVTPNDAENTEEVVAESESDKATPSPEEQVDEALRQLQTGEVPPMQAILKIRNVAETYPGNVKANYTLGELSMQTGQFDKAIERFETVLEKEAENGPVWRLLAEARLRTGDTVQAKENFAKAISLVDEPTAQGFLKELPELKD